MSCCVEGVVFDEDVVLSEKGLERLYMLSFRGCCYAWQRHASRATEEGVYSRHDVDKLNGLFSLVGSEQRLEAGYEPYTE